jgi:hypothetical protein
MTLLQQLFGISISLDGIAINMKWMLLWPMIAVNAWVYYRAFFKKEKSK